MGYLNRQQFLPSLITTGGEDQGYCSAGDISALGHGAGQFSAWIMTFYVPKFPWWLWYLNLCVDFGAVCGLTHTTFHPSSRHFLWGGEIFCYSL